ncbi:hypothetical protein QQ045_002456 [Rhodiola kirilowii]
MESNNWRPAQSDPPPNTIDAGDWRSLLQPDSRHRIVNKIMETLKKHLPFSGQDGLLELKKIAVRFEEKIYSAATSQSDYLRKISLKMLTMETKSQNTIAGSLATNPASSSRNPMEAVPQNMQPQVHNQGQSAPMALAANQPQGRQQMLAQNLPGNIASAGVQGSAGSASTLSSVSGMNQNPISNVINQSSIQNMADASHNAVGSSMGQGVATNVFNNQKPVSGRQQVQPGQQQSQQQFMYQQQLQQQFMKQKQLQQGSIPNSLMQSHIQQQQQQNVLQPNQMQSSQQAGISTSNAMLQQHPQSSLSSVHQSAQSMLQQHPQSALRQQQQQQSQQTPGLLQQQMTHQPTVMSQTSQPQQPLMSQQTNTSNMQPTQLLGQQNMSDMTQQQQQQQQQRLMNQQNNLSNLQQQQQLIAQQANLTNMHQQHMGHQGNVSGLQQQLHGTQSSNSGMQGNQHQMHMLHQNKGPVPQQNQQPASGLLASQGQQSQHPQTQMRSQIQSQSAQLQQQLGINQQQRDMQQRPQPAGTLMQPHNIPDQQKQMYQSQRPLPEASSTSIDSASQSGHANSADWQEEVYKKITVMKEKYLPEISELYQKISLKLQQHDSLPQPPKTDQLEKLRIFQTMLDRIITFLQVSKMNVNPAHRDKLASYEKQIVNFLNANRPRKPEQVPPHMQSMLLAQSQNMQAQPHDNHMNPQLQSANIQSPVMMQQNTSILQHNPMSSLAGVSNTQQNMIGSVQPGPNVEAGPGGGLASLQQGIGGHNTVSAPQQTNMNALSSQNGNGVNLLQPNISNLQSNSNVNQQHLKEQQIMQSQQLKHQFQQRQMQQQMMQNQQLLQQQQLHHQTKQQQQSGQMSAHQLPQVQQMGDVNDMNSRQVLGVKPGVFPQHHAAGQRSVYHQQMKPGVSFPMPSPQLLQTSPPQILQNSSPQMDQQNMLSSLSKAGTPLQSVNSPFVVPSPSTPLAPSPMPGDSEKLNSNVSTLTTAGNTRLQQSALPPAPSQSLAIGTPGISASPLLAEFSNHDATHGTTSAVVAKSSVIDQPLDRLIKAVKSVSNDAFTASVNDIGSVISMIDRIAGSAPGNGSRAAVGEDLVAMTKCRLQAKNFASQEGSNGSKKMKRLTSAMPLIVVSTNGSVNDSFKQHVGSELSDLESTATSRAKRPRIEVNHYLLEEIREINQRLIETMLAVSDEDADPSVAVAVAPEGGEGIIISCCYNAVGLSPNLKSQYASAQMSPIQPLRLLVPSSYPNCSPVLLDKLPVDVSNDDEDLSMKAKSKFSISLRTLSQPMSLGDIARTWDLCARAVVSEYAQASGGGSFSSRYGSWESVLSS